MKLSNIIKGKLSFINYKKEFPNSQGFKSFNPTINRYWFGKIYILCWRQYAIEYDMRENWVEDMINPTRRQ